MESLLPFDPYTALGVTSNATAPEIKAAYRKLVLTTHPDKFPDPTIKKQKEDDFHRIQQAWEKIGDDDERKKYDAALRLHAKVSQLRQEVRDRRGGPPSSSSRPQPTRRNATFAEFGGSAAYTTGPSTGANYEFRAPKFDDYEDGYGTYSSHQRSPPSNSRAEKVRASEREGTTSAERRARREDSKRRDEEERRARDYKYTAARQEDDRARYEEERKRRDREEADRQRRVDEHARREAARREEEDAMREAKRATSKKSSQEYYYPSTDHHAKKVADQENSAKAHISRTSGHVSGHRSSDEDRPKVERASSSRDHHQVRRSRASGRESTARTSERKISSDRDRKASLHPEVSAPPRTSASRVVHPEAKRSYSTQTDYDPHHPQSEPHPGPPPRLATEPTPASFPTKKKETSTSKLRGNDSGYSSPGTPETTFPSVPHPPPISTKYYVPAGADGVKQVDPKYHTITREPERFRDTSPVEMHPSSRDREPISSRREIPGVRYTAAVPRVPHSSSYSYPEPRPSLAAEARRATARESPTLGSSSRRERSRDRERRRERTPERRSHDDHPRRLFREVTPERSSSSYGRGENVKSYKYHVAPEKVNYTAPFKDVNVSPAYSPYAKDGRDQYFESRPHMYPRSQTTFA